MESSLVDKIVTKFFIEQAQNNVYHIFMEDLHEEFENMTRDFKMFAKKEFDSKTAHLQKTMYGDPDKLKEESIALQWDFDKLLPELIKMHATLLAAKLKEHTDMMLGVAESTEGRVK
ncbi:MAG: hypothetical protein V4568_17975 [Pseudomonadota bacterium]